MSEKLSKEYLNLADLIEERMKKILESMFQTHQEKTKNMMLERDQAMNEKVNQYAILLSDIKHDIRDLQSRSNRLFEKTDQLEQVEGKQNVTLAKAKGSADTLKDIRIWIIALLTSMVTFSATYFGMKK